MKENIGAVLNNSDFAVLATEGNGQPHASLIAITPLRIHKNLVFATYRNTLKFRNIQKNNKVAVLIESEVMNSEGLKQSLVLTIIGHTEEINLAEQEAAYQALAKRHPQMESFLQSPDCILLQIIAQSYQVVYGIDEIQWINADEMKLL